MPTEPSAPEICDRTGDLPVGQVQVHEVEAQYPDPQRLVAAGQRRAGEVVEAPGACLAAIPLPIGLSVVAPVPDHRVTAATGAAHALRPAALAHKGEALGVVHQTREVDQVGCSHGGEDSVHERGLLSPLAPAHQASFAPRPGPNLTTPKPDKSVAGNQGIPPSLIGLTLKRLWAPAAAISSARLALSWPFTSFR